MAIDTSVFNNIKTFQDYQRAEEDFQLKKRLAAAQELTAQAAYAKANEVDADKLGESAFLKAAQGMPLTPQETAALQYIDAKSPTAAFNPVTGAMEQKPSLLQRAGLGGGQAAAIPRAATPALGDANLSPSDANSQVVQLFGGDGAPVAQPSTPQSEFEDQYQKELNAAAGNPRLQQELKQKHAGATLYMNEEQAKNAGYADRMAQANPVIADKQAATTDTWQNIKGSVPLVGNFLTSDDYQGAKQAQLDFLNSILRRESGAAISTGEYNSYAKQYFPQPGDSEQVMAQKALNRTEALKGVQRGAGPAYKPTKIVTPTATPTALQSIPMNAAAALKQNPGLADQFDAKYGAGASKIVLEQ